MGKFNVVEQLEMKQRGGIGGIGGFNEDTSADLKDMRYWEKLVMDKDFLEALAGLKPAKRVEKLVNDVKKTFTTGGTIVIPISDIEGHSSKEAGAIAHGINKQFVALEIPYFATAASSEDAEKKTKVVDGKEKSAGRMMDEVRINKIGDKFNIDDYAAEASARCQPKMEKKEKVGEDGKVITDEAGNPVIEDVVVQPTIYHEPTKGNRDRAAKWINENGEDPEIYDALKAIGVDVD